MTGRVRRRERLWIVMFSAEARPRARAPSRRCLASRRHADGINGSSTRRAATLRTEISHQTHATTNAHPPPQRRAYRRRIFLETPAALVERHGGRRRLHLVHPLGFSTDERSLRRAGLDYWPKLIEDKLVVEHASWDDFVACEFQAEQTQQQSAGLGCTQHTPSGRIGTRLMLRATIYYLAARREAPLRRCTSMSAPMAASRCQWWRRRAARTSQRP